MKKIKQIGNKFLAVLLTAAMVFAPVSYTHLCAVAGSSDFIKAHIPEKVLQIYCNQ